MSRRAGQPDTSADVRLRQRLLSKTRKSFVMVAGAGSGKTTSLIKALSSIIDGYGPSLKRRRQRIACITYTDVAAGEIWADVGQNALVHVSTIHSFLWLVAKPFQRDIKSWVVRRIDEKLAELEAEAAAWSTRVRETTKAKNRKDIERYRADRLSVEKVRIFTYGTGSNYPNGILGHDDIFKMAGSFTLERPLFRSLIAQQFPFLFVDESQDTTKEVVAALKSIEAQMQSSFCLGFFGDPMQRIYPTGIGKIELEPEWEEIDKPENFRCSQAVLSVANAIRDKGDALVQIGGRKEQRGEESIFVEGSARIFVLPADDRRDEWLGQVRWWVGEANRDQSWNSGDEVKVLVIVHRMAAKRLGFADLYAALNDGAPDSFKSGFLDGTAWPLRPFLSFALPMSQAVGAGREFEAMQLLRQHCPKLSKEALRGRDVAELLGTLRKAAHKLADLMKNGFVSDVLTHLGESQLMSLDPRFSVYMNAQAEAGDLANRDEQGESDSKDVAAMTAFLEVPAAQFSAYRNYIDELSPFSTQQGVKGTEFSKVLVVLDDDEGTHNQFSYDKYFGVKEPSRTDQKNMDEGKETSVDRTRRLLYVCCTRARTDLVVVYFCADPILAERKVRALGIFPADKIHTLADLQH